MFGAATAVERFLGTRLDVVFRSIKYTVDIWRMVAEVVSRIFRQGRVGCMEQSGGCLQVRDYT